MGIPLRTLIIEDSEDDTLLMIRLLRKAGYDPAYERVETADAMHEALERQTWDIIISDYNMPNFDGLAALNIYKEKKLDIPFIIVSGAIGEEIAVEAMKTGAHDYVMKNNLPRLVPAIQRELREAESRRGRKQAEQALKESKALVEAVVENIPLMIFLKEATDLRFVIFNRAGEELLGYDRRDLIGKNNLDLFPPEQAAHFMAKDREVLDGETGMLDIPEEPILTAKKGLRLLHTRKVCIQGPDGTTKFLLGISEDITERTQAKEALMESEKKYNELAHFLPQIVFEADTKGNLTFVNNAAYSISGYSPEEFKRGLNISQMLVPEDRDRARLNIQSILHGEESQSNEYTFLRKDGRTFPVITETIPIIRNNQTLGLRGLVVNITERKQAEGKLKQQGNAMEASIDGIAILNEDQNYVYVNEAHARIYGYDTSEELIGKSWTVLYDEDELQRFSHEIMPEFIRKGQWRGEATGKKKDGSAFPQEVSLTGLDNGGLICVVRDITSRKHAEEHLKETLEKLRKSLIGTIQALSSTVETRDPYTAGHQRRVSSLARAIAQEMRLSNDTVDTIRMAGIIHDIGKISVPAEILSKPGKISDIEMSLIKVHPQAGYDILKDVGLPYPIAEMVLQHHERLDGSGYPQGLKGDQILLEAQIVFVADVVEAISSVRPYRPALGIDAALQEIEKNKGILYNEKVVEVCIKLFSEKGFIFKSTES
jgi:PAS domain S-box-containing protein